MAFLLENLSEDALRSYLDRLDYLSAVRLCKSSKALKEYIDLNNITFPIPNSFLCYEQSKSGPDRILKKIKKHGEYSNPDCLHHIKEVECDAAMARFRTVKLEYMNKEYFRETVTKDLWGMRGIHHLAIATELDEEDFLEAIRLARPRILTVNLQCYVKHVELFKNPPATMQYTKFRLISKVPVDILKDCNHAETLDFYPNPCCQAEAVRMILEKWASGADVGDLKEVRVGVDGPIIRMIAQQHVKTVAENMESFVKQYVADTFVAKRNPSIFGKDAATLRWLPNHLVITFR